MIEKLATRVDRPVTTVECQTATGEEERGKKRGKRRDERRKWERKRERERKERK